MKTRIVSFLAVALLVSSTAACHRHAKPNEGPVERAGKKVDNAADKTKDAAKDVKEGTKDTAKDVKRDVK